MNYRNEYAIKSLIYRIIYTPNVYVLSPSMFFGLGHQYLIRTVPTRVSVLQRIIQAVAIPVEALRVSGIGDYGIRADKPPNRRVIIPCSVIIKSRIVMALAGKLNIRGYGAGVRFAKGQVLDFTQGVAGISIA